jgi:hypothetical protein
VKKVAAEKNYFVGPGRTCPKRTRNFPEAPKERLRDARKIMMSARDGSVKKIVDRAGALGANRPARHDGIPRSA